MKETLAIVSLECRRLGAMMASLGLMAGLCPALIAGLGGTIPAASQLAVVFLLVGVAAGGTFGTDFAEGRGSFFFARPLPSASLLLGRVAGLGALAAMTSTAFMASFWISSSEASRFEPGILETRHLRVLGTSWVLSLFCALAVAVQARSQGPARRLRDIARSGLTMLTVLGAFLLTFGLFSDLIVRAYFGSEAPVRAFLWSWVVACLGASGTAIVAGRSDRLRIARFQNGVMGAYLAVASAIVLVAWTYVLRPGPGAILSVARGSVISPDGRHAFVPAIVNRGDPSTFRPVFHLDLSSEAIDRFNADPSQGPWFSADGRAMAWSEATPFFFRPLLRFATGATSYRVRKENGVEPAPVPGGLTQGASRTDHVFRGGARMVLPSRDGDTFAIEWNGHLTLTSRSKGELADIDLNAAGSYLLAAAFTPAGELRTVISRRANSADQLEWVDIHPDSGRTKRVGSVEASRTVRARFDATAAHALVEQQTTPGRSTLTLFSIGATPEALRSIVLVADAVNPSSVFLSGERVGLLTRDKEGRVLRILGMTGDRLQEMPVDRGTGTLLNGEMFPGVVAVAALGSRELLLFDVAGGGLVRRLEASSSVLTHQDAAPPPPGSPGARLLVRDGKLHILESPIAEPRQILPVMKP